RYTLGRGPTAVAVPTARDARSRLDGCRRVAGGACRGGRSHQCDGCGPHRAARPATQLVRAPACVRVGQRRSGGVRRMPWAPRGGGASRWRRMRSIAPDRALQNLQRQLGRRKTVRIPYRSLDDLVRKADDAVLADTFLGLEGILRKAVEQYP